MRERQEAVRRQASNVTRLISKLSSGEKTIQESARELASTSRQLFDDYCSLADDMGHMPAFTDTFHALRIAVPWLHHATQFDETGDAKGLLASIPAIFGFEDMLLAASLALTDAINPYEATSHPRGRNIGVVVAELECVMSMIDQPPTHIRELNGVINRARRIIEDHRDHPLFGERIAALSQKIEGKP